MRMMLGLILVLFMGSVIFAAQSDIKAEAYACKEQCCVDNGGTYDSSTTVCSDSADASGACIDDCYSQSIITAAEQSGKSSSEANSLADQDTQCMRDCCGSAGGTLDSDNFCNGDRPDGDLGGCYKDCFDSTL